MSELVAEGRRLVAEQEAERRRAEQEAEAMAELRVTAPAILDLLTAISAQLVAFGARLDQLEARQDNTWQAVIATRVRRPVRDELGTILYVVDELQPPVWAVPIDTPAS